MRSAWASSRGKKRKKQEKSEWGTKRGVVREAEINALVFTLYSFLPFTFFPPLLLYISNGPPSTCTSFPVQHPDSAYERKHETLDFVRLAYFTYIASSIYFISCILSLSLDSRYTNADPWTSNVSSTWWLRSTVPHRSKNNLRA